MTIQNFESIIKYAGAAILVALAVVLFVLNSRYILPVLLFIAVVFAVYATGRIARKGILRLR